MTWRGEERAGSRIVRVAQYFAIEKAPRGRGGGNRAETGINGYGKRKV